MGHKRAVSRRRDGPGGYGILSAAVLESLAAATGAGRIAIHQVNSMDTPTRGEAGRRRRIIAATRAPLPAAL
jgi:hypothetical protein